MFPGVMSGQQPAAAGGGAAAFIGGASSGQAFTTSRTVSLPAEAVEGDLAIVIVNSFGPESLSPPAGFTTIFNTTANFGFHAAYKNLTATDISNGTLTATCSGGGNFNFGLSVFRGINYVQFDQRYDADDFDLETPAIAHTAGNHYLGIAASQSSSAGILYVTKTANYIRAMESTGAAGRYAQHTMDYQLGYPTTESANVEWEESGRNAVLGGSRCIIIELEDAA